MLKFEFCELQKWKKIELTGARAPSEVFGNYYFIYFQTSEDLVHMDTNDTIFKNIRKSYFWVLKKSENKNLDVANYLSHKHEKIMFKYIVFWATQKR
jgi:hypothetical protein